MFTSALILGLTGFVLPAAVGTLSSDDHTKPVPARDADAEVALIPRLGVGCGVGSNLLGAEYACWLRARPSLGQTKALTLSMGLSRGHFVQNDTTEDGVFGFFTGPLSAMGHGPERAEREFQHAYWLNSDIGYESRRGGFLFRAFIGGAALLNPSDGVERVWLSSNLPATTRPSMPWFTQAWASVWCPDSGRPGSGHDSEQK